VQATRLFLNGDSVFNSIIFGIENNEKVSAFHHTIRRQLGVRGGEQDQLVL